MSFLLAQKTKLVQVLCALEVVFDLLGGAVDGAVVDAIDDVVGVHAVHGAANRLGSAKHLLHGAGELLGHGPGSHNPGGCNNVIHGDVAAVLDVLDLLAVPWRLLQGLDNKGSS